jgi:hypothetical protein
MRLIQMIILVSILLHILERKQIIYQAKSKDDVLDILDEISEQLHDGLFMKQDWRRINEDMAS